VLARIAGERGEAFNVWRMLAHSPRALEALYGLASYLWKESSIDPDLQELLILRVAQLTGSDYEWARHRGIARHAGVTEAKVEALSEWNRQRETYSPKERAALAVVEEATVQIEASEESVAALRRVFDDTAVVEIVLLGGLYAMVARFLRTLDVDVEAGGERLPPESVSPIPARA
jgi:4-carboxymuconolactone decarboxylase